MLKLTYRPAALTDLDSIYDFIEPENPRRALSFVQDIRARCRTLCAYPQLGITRDDLGEGIQIFPMRGRVVVAYRVTRDAVEVTRVFYGGQDYEAILRDGDGFPE